jgi:hypothetical protein
MVASVHRITAKIIWRSRASRGRAVVQEHGAASRLRPAGFHSITRKRDRTPTLPIAHMRHVAAATDDWPHHSGGGYTLIKQTLRPVAVASEMGQQRTRAMIPLRLAGRLRLHHPSTNISIK